MKISIHNYREWMEAYMAGRLDADAMETAENLMLDHPDIMNEYLEEANHPRLVPDPSVSINLASLLVHISATENIHQQNYLEYFVGALENTLSLTEKQELDRFLEKNPALEKEYQVMLACKVAPDVNIIYPAKQELMRRPAPLIAMRWATGIAAGIILLLGIFLLWPADEKNGNGMMAGNRPATKDFRDAGTDDTTGHQGPVNVQEQKNNIGLPNTLIGGIDKQKNNREGKNNFYKKQPGRIEKSIYASSENKRELERSVQLETSSPQFIKQDIAYNIHKEDFFSNISSGDEVAVVNNRKKDLFTKVIRGQKTYVEDYVNLGFRSLKKNRNDEDKWVLRVERDANGKSKGIKFASPLFSFKTKN